MKLFQPLLILACIIGVTSLLAACGILASTTPAMSEETTSPPTIPAATPTAISPSATATTMAMLKPGDKIDEMLISTGPGEMDGPPIWAFCPPAFSEEPGVKTIECSVPPLPELPVGHGWFAADEAKRDASWKSMDWGLTIDGQSVDLNTFGAVDVDLPQTGLPGHDPDEEVITKLRTWDVLLSGLAHGPHTLQSVMHASQDIDDGFHITKAGTYKLLVNLTVEAAPTATPTLPPPTATLTPRPTATLAPSEFIASSVEDLVGIWKHFFNPAGEDVYIQYKPDGTWAIAATLEKLSSSPPDTFLEGTFEFDGVQFITVDGLCGTNKEGKYQIRITLEDGQPSRAALLVIEDACRERVGDLRKGYQWVQP